MQKCVMIHDDSLRFSRAVYGALVLAAFLIHNYWLVLVTSLLMAAGTVSLKLNIPYQLHALSVKKPGKNDASMISKDPGEITFVSGMTAAMLFAGFLLLYFGKFTDFAWIYVLIVALLIFLACFVGFCVATMMYVFFKKAFAQKTTRAGRTCG